MENHIFSSKSLTCEIETFSGQHEARGYLLADKTFWVPKVFVQVDMIQPKKINVANFFL